MPIKYVQFILQVHYFWQFIFSENGTESLGQNSKFTLPLETQFDLNQIKFYSFRLFQQKEKKKKKQRKKK